MPDARNSQSRPSSRALKSNLVPPTQRRPETPAITASQPPLRQKKSKTSSLFHLFSKPNVEKQRGHHEPMPVPPVADAPPDISLDRPSTRMSTRSSKSRPSSRLSFMSRNDSPTRNQQDRPSSRMERPSSRLSLRRIGSTITGRSSTPKPTTPAERARLETPWDPPPLFQAYPQAIKHTLLKIPGPAFDPSNPAQGYQQRASDPNASRGSMFGRPKSRLGIRIDSSKSGDKGTERWSKKVYVLVTSGHLLEYAGDGPYDRMPEKVLRLGPDSAAFASDLIPGFPYVLQVLQTASAGVQVVQLPQKSFRARLGLKSASSRRVASNILLVFNEPEPMDSWMIAIRREIEVLGGKKSRPESIVMRPTEDDDNESPVAVSRYESITRSSSRGSNYTANLTARPSMRDMTASPLPVITEGSSIPEPGKPRAWPWSQAPVDENSSSSEGSRADASLDTLPTQESHSLSGDWFKDLPSTDTPATKPAKEPPQHSMSSYRPSNEYLHHGSAGVPLSDRSSLEHSAHDTNILNGRPRERQQHQTNSNSNRTYISSFSKPRYAHSQKPSITTIPQPPPSTNSRLLHQNKHAYTEAEKLGLGIQAYSDVSTASEISSASTRTSTATIPGTGSNATVTPITSTPRAQPRNNGGTTTTLTPLLTSTYSQWHSSPNPTSPTMTSPTLSQGGRNSPSPPNVLRRPASLPVHSDPVPFLSALAKSPRTGLQRHPSNSGRGGKGSTLVPIVRPPSTNKGRTNKLASNLSVNGSIPSSPVVSSPLTSRPPSGMGWPTAPGGPMGRSGAVSPVVRSGAVSPSLGPGSRPGSVLAFSAQVHASSSVSSQLPPRGPPPTSPLPLPPGIAV